MALDRCPAQAEAWHRQDSLRHQELLGPKPSRTLQHRRAEGCETRQAGNGVAVEGGPQAGKGVGETEERAARD